MKIKGYFGDISAANNAIKELERAGFEEAFVDINDHYIGNRNVFTNNPGTSTSGSLANLVLQSSSGHIDMGNSPLAAASPMVSGMSSFEEISNINYTVNVKVSNEDAQSVRDILKNAGGYLEDPNISRKKAISNPEVDLENVISGINHNLKMR